MDDNKGEGDWLLEVNEFGRGIRVKASYLVLLSKAGQSDQRVRQILVDSPMQYFFANDTKTVDKV